MNLSPPTLESGEYFPTLKRHLDALGASLYDLSLLEEEAMEGPIHPDLLRDLEGTRMRIAQVNRLNLTPPELQNVQGVLSCLKRSLRGRIDHHSLVETVKRMPRFWGLDRGFAEMHRQRSPQDIVTEFSPKITARLQELEDRFKCITPETPYPGYIPPPIYTPIAPTEGQYADLDPLPEEVPPLPKVPEQRIESLGGRVFVRRPAPAPVRVN